jgi:hypothetical protein
MMHRWQKAEGYFLIEDLTLSWEGFTPWAESLCQRQNYRVISKERGADRHVWQIEINGLLCLLQFEGLSETIWLEPMRSDDWPQLQASLVI